MASSASQAVLLAGVGGKHEPQFGGTQSAGEIAATPERRDEVVEHPHRRLMRRPRPNERGGDVGRDGRAAAERVEQQRLSRTEVRDDVVARQPDAGEWHVGPPRCLDVDGRQQDRQAASALEHAVEHRVLRPVVLLGVPGEAVQRAQDVRDGEGLGLRRARGVLQDAGDLFAELVERGERSCRVDWTERGRQREREQVQRRVRGRSQVLEARQLHQSQYPRTSALAPGASTTRPSRCGCPHGHRH